jgi:hypothetical protein
MKLIATIIAFCFPLICSAEPVCKTMSKVLNGKDNVLVEICLVKGAFSHDMYTVKLNDVKVAQDIDDNIVQFSVTSAGKKVTGGCTPNIQMEELGGTKIPVEISRTCKVSLDGVEVGSMEFQFD